MVPSNPTDLVAVKAEMARWMPKLPTWLQSPGATHVPSLSRSGESPVVLSWWPMACAGGKLEGITSPGLLVLDDSVDQSESKPHLDWRRWLQLFNTWQTLPGMVMTTVSGIQAGDLESLLSLKPKEVTPAGSSDHVALSQEWVAALDMTIDGLRSGLRTMVDLGVLPPVIGHELADERGMVVAEAEMAWMNAHLVLLTFDQSDLAGVWKDAGWKTLVLDEVGATVNGEFWTDTVCTALGIVNTRKSNEGESA